MSLDLIATSTRDDLARVVGHLLAYAYAVRSGRISAAEARRGVVPLAGAFARAWRTAPLLEALEAALARELATHPAVAAVEVIALAMPSEAAQ